MSNYINPDRGVVIAGLDPVVKFHSFKMHFEEVTADRALVEKDSGKLLGLNKSDGLTITLPSLAQASDGWYVDIYVKAANGSGNYVVSEHADDTDKIVAFGQEIATTGAQIYKADTSTITFQTGPSLGDSVRIFCDGSQFVAKCLTQDDDGVVFA